MRGSGVGEARDGTLMFSGRGEGEGGERRVTRDGLTGAAVRQYRKRSVHEEYPDTVQVRVRQYPMGPEISDGHGPRSRMVGAFQHRICWPLEQGG